MEKLIDEIKCNLESIVGSCSDSKRVDNYLQWIKTYSDIILHEKDSLCIDSTKLPTTITEPTYNYLYPTIQKLITTYYYKDEDKHIYIKSSKSINSSDCLTLYKSLVLVKRNIIWINFGFNIGCEFGGTHPAVILKNLGDVVIVAPISSNTNNISPSSTVVCIAENEVYNMPSRRKRFTNITRIIPVSILRIDTASKPGSLSSNKFHEIISKLKNYYN